MTATTTSYDVERIRKDFPILSRQINGRPLIYLDSSNTSQKPQQVIDAEREFYEVHNANVARAIHTLGAEATEAYENSRVTVARFLNAADEREIIYTKNSTEAINLVARVLGDSADGSRARVGPGTEVLISEMEHHSNIVPWQLLCERTGATLRWFPLTDDGRLDLTDLDGLLNERTAIVSFVHMSNILGTINPVDVIVRRAREVGALVMLDASQSVPHMTVDVQSLGVDFLAATGHKMCGPTGIGFLWGRLSLLEELPPFLGGGEMIEEVAMTGSTYAGPPHRFEAGTPPIAQAVALGAAVDYLTDIGMDAISAHEHELAAYLLDVLPAVDGVRVIGPLDTVDRGGIVSFTLGGIHPHDVGQVLDELGIAVRVGHHCAKPTCVRFGVPATTRASVYLYTTKAEIDALAKGLEQVQRYFA
ncbi:MAG: cysteine desulfurase / selenocysteine lyase [Frankiales bacterium]|nr:cysteine desulfurase / selenocysteine lyase [Frankiales bacterium]